MGAEREEETRPITVFYIDPTKPIDKEVTEKILKAVRGGTEVLVRRATGGRGKSIVVELVPSLPAEIRDRIKGLEDIASRFPSSESLETYSATDFTGHSIIEELIAHTGAEAGFLARLEGDKIRSLCRYEGASWIPFQREWELGSGALGQCLLSLQPYFAEDVTRDPVATGEESDLLGVRSVIAVPLLSEEEAFGAVQLERRSGHFTERDLQTAQVLCRRFAPLVLLAIKLDQVKETREILYKTLDAIPHPLFVVSTERIILAANEEFLQLARKEKHELVGKSCCQVLHNSSTPPECCLQTLALHKKSAVQETTVLEALDKELLIRCQVLGNGKAACVHLCLLSTDQPSLEERTHTIQGLALVGRLFSEASHELNNAFAGITGYCELLEAEPDLSPRKKERVSIIRREVSRISQLISQLQRIAGKTEKRETQVNINEAVEDAISLRTERFLNQGITVQLFLARDLPLLRGSRRQLTQAVLNIISNAEEAISSSGKGDSIFIASTYKPAENLIELTIADNGPGIPPEVLTSVFEPFFTTKREPPGLGLWASKKIIELHRGSISIDSTPGHGTTVTIQLPLPESRTDRALESVSILIVEDEESIRELLREALAPQGYEVTVTSDPAEALNLISSTDYHLIVTDLVMPGISGVELYQTAVQSRPDLKGNFCFLTGELYDASIRDFIRKFPGRYLIKPFGVNEFVEFVGSCLTASREAQKEE